MNDINIKQNKKENLEKLYAQANLYSSAKKYKGLQILLSVILLAIISILKIYYNQLNLEALTFIKLEKISPYLSLMSLFITFINTFWLKEIISKKVKQAAMIQYDFDSSVLSIPMNPFYKNDVVSNEEIRRHSKKIKNKEEFDNWYSTKIESTNISLGKMLCLRSNFSWDVGLRTKYRNTLVALGLITSILFLIINFISGITFRDVILNLFIPLMPLIIFILNEIIDNHKSIVKKEKVKIILDDIGHKLIESKIPLGELEFLSNSCLELLYQSRKDNPLIFDHIYHCYRTKDQDEMDYSIEAFLSKINITI
jgi:hypothetical protein